MDSQLSDFFTSKLNEECGIFGVFNNNSAVELTYYGLHSLQHRGQEACGIVSHDGKSFKYNKSEGLVTEVFNENIINKLTGINAIGHVRYSTSGGGGIDNVQPFLFNHSTGNFSFCHNGNIINYDELKKQLERKGSIFSSTSDSEILAHLIKTSKESEFIEVLKDSLNKIDGAFNFLLLSEDKLYAIRDKYGLRPLSIGKLNDGTYLISSESCAFEIVGAKFVRDVEPGEIVVFSKQQKLDSYFYSQDKSYNMCAMEYIYFSRPDSNIEGLNVHEFRKITGRLLAQQSPIEADIVIGVPESSLSAAMGYSEQSGIPYEIGLIKSKYVGRTFIQPSQQMRERGVKMKLSVITNVVKGKKIVLIDDSIVRGTTSKKIISMLKDADASEVHLKIASPPLQYPCFYGVDISCSSQLVSYKKSVEQVRQQINSDSLEFISTKNFLKANNRKKMCMACFTGNYTTNLYSKEKLVQR